MKTMKTTLLGLAVLLIVSLFGFNQAVKAQENADMTVTAEVLRAIEVAVVTPLAFERLLQGTTKRIDAEGNVTGDSGFDDEGTQGQFSIGKAPGASVTVELDLVTELADGSNELPISFNDTDFGLLFDTNTPTNTLAFNPTETFSAAFLDFFEPLEEISLFIGGEVNATGTVPEGEYEADITLTVSYN